MYSSCLAIILGLFIIYLLFSSNQGKEGLQQRDLLSYIKKLPHKGKKFPASTIPLHLPPSSSPSPTLSTTLQNQCGDSSLLLEGTEVVVFNSPCGTDCPPTQKARRHYYDDYMDVYKKTINRYPQEDIRFDLLTPIPYSDAFVAPMGPPDLNILPKATLAQITYPHATIPHHIRS